MILRAERATRHVISSNPIYKDDANSYRVSNCKFINYNIETDKTNQSYFKFNSYNAPETHIKNVKTDLQSNNEN